MSDGADDYLDCADTLIFGLGFRIESVEQMTIDDMGHYLNRFVAWRAKQNRR